MMYYTEYDEWVVVDDDNEVALFGLTEEALSNIGDITAIILPRVGSKVAIGDEVVVLESDKAAIDLYSPLSGIITEVNESLLQDIDLLKTAGVEQGWIYKIEYSNENELKNLFID